MRHAGDDSRASLEKGAKRRNLRWACKACPTWYNRRYAQSTKTAISISDRLFRSADALARKLGMSRSRLYATALAEYVAKHQAAKVTERLNEVYGERPSGLDAKVRRAQGRALVRGEW